MRAPVSLRDALIAMAELAPRDEATRGDLLRLLGLAGPRAGETAVAATAPERTPPPPPPGDRATAPSPAPRPSSAPAPVRSEAVPATLVKSGTTTTPARPPWLAVPTREVLARASAAATAPPPPPILAPLEARGIYTAALATWVREGDPDAGAAIRERAAGRPFREIPRIPLRTLRRGVQLLLDVGPSMAPFVSDVSALERSLALLFGDGQIERLFFARCPTRQVRSGRRAPRRTWRAPARGVPLLVVSDFGIVRPSQDGDAATPAEWRRFADAVRAEGHRIVGLVPFAPARWPSAVAEAVTLVHWSEHTIAGAVHRAVRESQRGDLR
jgi:hypothetical protein